MTDEREINGPRLAILVGSQLAISVLQRLIANYESQRDKISDSDLDNEQPIAITFRGQLGDVRNAQHAIGLLREEFSRALIERREADPDVVAKEIQDRNADVEAAIARATRAEAQVKRLVEALQYLVGECDSEMDADYNPHAAPLARARAVLADIAKEG